MVVLVDEFYRDFAWQDKWAFGIPTSFWVVFWFLAVPDSSESGLFGPGHGVHVPLSSVAHGEAAAIPAAAWVIPGCPFGVRGLFGLPAPRLSGVGPYPPRVILTRLDWALMPASLIAFTR